MSVNAQCLMPSNPFNGSANIDSFRLLSTS